MNRIALELLSIRHRASLDAGYSLPTTRLLASVSFQRPSGWTPPCKGIVDTGTGVSLIPKDVWQGTAFQTITKLTASGIVNRPECSIPATLAMMACVLSSPTNRIGPLNMHALLADSDQVPLLLGVSGILERLRLVVDIPHRDAALEVF